MFAAVAALAADFAMSAAPEPFIAIFEPLIFSVISLYALSVSVAQKSSNFGKSILSPPFNAIIAQSGGEIKGGVIITAKEKAFVIKARKRMVTVGMNDRELAEKLNISRSYLSMIFSGSRTMTEDIRERIRLVLNI